MWFCIQASVLVISFYSFPNRSMLALPDCIKICMQSMLVCMIPDVTVILRPHIVICAYGLCLHAVLQKWLKCAEFNPLQLAVSCNFLCFELYAIFLFLWCFSLYMTSFYSELLLTGVMFFIWNYDIYFIFRELLCALRKHWHSFRKWFCSGSPNGLCIPSMHVWLCSYNCFK
jgi:hypothetical protein